LAKIDEDPTGLIEQVSLKEHHAAEALKVWGRKKGKYEQKWIDQGNQRKYKVRYAVVCNAIRNRKGNQAPQPRAPSDVRAQKTRSCSVLRMTLLPARLLDWS
jgi:hypothetical protein